MFPPPPGERFEACAYARWELSAAMESIFELGLHGSMTVVGLAKNEEEIFFPGDQQSLKLPYDSMSLRLIRKIRDEVHRFGISFHRNKRSRGTFKILFCKTRTE